ncbi:hypothetical protein RIF29_30241 [Crotalaria pallida]|uniref:DUF4283 domain-containing protein n=1 Tax=Crotalaria pallida TaxID=3830 RepID=A0AAN9EFZ7_CROPI
MDLRGTGYGLHNNVLHHLPEILVEKPIFKEVGCHSISSVSLGGLHVLIKVACDEGFGKLRDKYALTFDQFFQQIVPWTPYFSLVEHQHQVWVRCTGLPLHAWGINISKTLSMRIGTFVAMIVDSSMQTWLEFARVLISTSSLAVVDSMVIPIKVNELNSTVRLVEELTDDYGDFMSLTQEEEDIQNVAMKDVNSIYDNSKYEDDSILGSIVWVLIVMIKR